MTPEERAQEVNTLNWNTAAHYDARVKNIAQAITEAEDAMKERAAKVAETNRMGVHSTATAIRRLK